jgi:hypothetical protein
MYAHPSIDRPADGKAGPIASYVAMMIQIDDRCEKMNLAPISHFRDVLYTIMGADPASYAAEDRDAAAMELLTAWRPMLTSRILNRIRADLDECHACINAVSDVVAA